MPYGICNLQTASEELVTPRTEEISATRKEELMKLFLAQAPTALGLVQNVLDSCLEKAQQVVFIIFNTDGWFLMFYLRISNIYAQRPRLFLWYTFFKDFFTRDMSLSTVLFKKICVKSLITVGLSAVLCSIGVKNVKLAKVSAF